MGRVGDGLIVLGLALAVGWAASLWGLSGALAGGALVSTFLGYAVQQDDTVAPVVRPGPEMMDLDQQEQLQPWPRRRRRWGLRRGQRPGPDDIMPSRSEGDGEPWLT